MNNARIKLSNCCQIVGRSIDPQANQDEIFAHYSIPAFDRCLGPSLESGEAIKSNKLEIPSGVVLFSKLNPRIPRVWYVSEETSLRRIASTEFVPLQFDQSTVDGRFLSYALQEPVTINYLRGEVAAATKSRERLAPERVLDAEIPQIPLARQREIVARLDAQLAAAARARAAVGAQLAEAERLTKVLADSEFPVGRWPMVLIGELAMVAGGIQKTPDRAPAEFHRPFLTVRNVQRGALDLSVVERFEVSPAELERNRLEAGDLLIVEGNGSREHIGRNALFPAGMSEEWIHQNHIIRVRFDRARVEPRFASHFFNSTAGREQMLERAATTTGLYTLSTAKVAALELPLPSIKEQRLIAGRIEAALVHVSALRTRLAARLAELDLLPAALLRTAFADP